MILFAFTDEHILFFISFIKYVKLIFSCFNVSMCPSFDIEQKIYVQIFIIWVHCFSYYLPEVLDIFCYLTFFLHPCVPLCSGQGSYIHQLRLNGFCYNSSIYCCGYSVFHNSFESIFWHQHLLFLPVPYQLQPPKMVFQSDFQKTFISKYAFDF